MERRVVLAVLLAIGVLFLTPRLFPPPRRTPVPTAAVDTQVPALTRDSVATPRPTVETVRQPDSVASAPVSAPVESVVVRTAEAAYVFRTPGAVLERVELPQYQALNGTNSTVRLDAQAPLLRYWLVVPNDTLRLEPAVFATSYDTAQRIVEYTGSAAQWRVKLRYTVNAGYVVRASGEVTDSTGRPAGDGVYLIVKLPQILESFEANTIDDRRGTVVAYKPAARGASQTGLGSLDPNELKIEPGPLRWVALKSKYFMLGLVSVDTTAPFDELQIRGLARPDRVTPAADISIVQRLRGGRMGFDIYAGPQQWDAMVAVGRDFESANSYGGWLQPIVQPFARIVMRVLLWMHRVLNLHYGWVLLLFGVLVRIAMWPLNQSAMRSSMRMQELQPLLAEVQKRHKNDPQRMSAETMRLYKEHGMSPFSPLAGCFPILLSMPILFALFFVFQSTIEFRGVPFLWLQDISLKDPFYIAPLLMGGSMFLTSWLSMRSAPPNPQTKIMTYVLPVMMTVLLANMASGLNLYWAAQNVASLPQQWLIARERARARKPHAPAKK
ncbi:MAG TPA: membrane protein insertase YidC [Gemmatimonadaceae bacterium]|nr:membrane protein insertase YidC [Gemmatimonadaceae bacterium]